MPEHVSVENALRELRAAAIHWGRALDRTDDENETDMEQTDARLFDAAKRFQEATE